MALSPGDPIVIAAPKLKIVRARRIGRFTSLTGAWSGIYRYPSDWPDTPFNALIEETRGIITGKTIEPDVREGFEGAPVTAMLWGERRGLDVGFVKQMDGSGDMTHAINYEGRANDALTLIEGAWTIPNVWSGTFFMERDESGAEQAAAKTARA